MKYIFYLLTIALLFAGGMVVGNRYLPDHSTVRASAVSVPELNTQNPIFSHTTREDVSREIDILDTALQSCPVVVNEEKDKIINHIKLWLALEDFELKKAMLELEMAKNVESNRPTDQFLQAAQDYNAAREKAEKMADELFPPFTAAGMPAAASASPAATAAQTTAE